MEYEKIDWNKVFANIPEVTGLPFVLNRGKWYAACYLNGQKHRRWDKSNARLVNDTILVAENGGECLSLQNFLLKYRGFANYREVMEYLLGKEHTFKPCNLPILPQKVEDGKFVSWSEIERGMCNMQHDNLYIYLIGIFGKDRVDDAYKKYYVGVGNHNETIYWYINKNNMVCHDKWIRYNGDGHRIKDGGYNTGRKFKVGDGYTNRCYFGEHLITDESRIMVLEAEKSAIIASICYPKYTWLATGGKSSGLALIKGAKYIPDIDAFADWGRLYGSDNVVKWWKIVNFVMETGKEDFADYLLKINTNMFV